MKSIIEIDANHECWVISQWVMSDELAELLNVNEHTEFIYITEQEGK